MGWLLLINEQAVLLAVNYMQGGICSLRRRLRLPRSALGVGPDCGMYGTFDKILYS